MRSGVSPLVTASHCYHYRSTSWRHPFTLPSPLKTSVLYWSVANSGAGFVYAIQGAAAYPSPLRGPAKPSNWQSQYPRRDSLISGGVHSPTSAARRARSTSPGPGSAMARRCSTMRAANTSRTSGGSCASAWQRNTSRPPARHRTCSTASAASVTRWEPPRIASSTSTRSRGFIPAYRPTCPANGPDDDSQAVAGAEFRWPGQIDQAAGLAPLEVRNDSVGDGRGSNAIHDEPHHAWRPSGGVPLQLDQDEQVAGEK